MSDGIRYITLTFIGLVYLFTVAGTQTGGDSAELTITASNLWLSHAPGYPFWNQLGHWWLQLFNRGPTEALSLLSAVYGLIAVSCLMSIIEYFVEDKNLATFAGSYLAFTPLFWRYNIEVEVFALTHMLFFAFIRLGLEFLKTQKMFFAGLALFVFGFLIAHHYFMLPFLSVIGLWWIITKLNWSQIRPTWVLLSLILILCGFTPYLVFWVPQITVGKSTHWHSFSELLSLFLRKEYGSFQLFLARAEPKRLEHLQDFLKFVFFSGQGICILIAPITYIWLRSGPLKFAKWKHREVFMVLLIATLVQIVSFILMSKFEVHKYPWLYSTVVRFWILPEICILMLLLSGLGYFLKSCAFRNLKWKQRTNFVLVLFLILSTLFQVINNFEHESRKKILAYDQWARHIFKLARESSSIIFSISFQESAMLTYVKMITPEFSQIRLVTPHFFLNEVQFNRTQDLVLPPELQAKPLFVQKGVLALFKLNPDINSVILATPLDEKRLNPLINEKVVSLQGCQIFLRNDLVMPKLVSLQKSQAWFSAQDIFDPVLPPKADVIIQ